MCQKILKGGDRMTRKEVTELLKEEERHGNEEVMALVSYINLYLPMFMKHPEAASKSDVNRYNSLVRSNVHERYLLDKLVITK